MDPAFSGLITLAGVIIASYLTYRAATRKLRSDSGQQMIDQHQEDITRLIMRVDYLERVSRIQGDYIGSLRRHIADGDPPPPPPWPHGLIS